ncbi:MAG: hypothetical protein Q9213_003256 [Squamulea squamosa]
MPNPTFPPGLQPESNSAYVVIPELSAGNACTQIARFESETFTFGPGQLSTIQGPANVTKAFNFEDLPCPPPDIASDVVWFYNPAYNPTQTYAPFLAPFPQLYNLHPAFRYCTVAMNQGLDPPTPLPTALGPTLPQGPLQNKRLGARMNQMHRRKHLVGAHHVPRVPVETGQSSMG